jgi:hypothetical protein
VKDSNWDLDLRAGLTGESRVADLLSLDTVEVKTDRRWHETGNLYIETSCYYKGTDSWQVSGMVVSKATHWAFLMEDTLLIIPLDYLRQAVYKHGKSITCNIPPNPSRGYLITPATLLEFVRLAKADEKAAHDAYESWSDPAEWEDPV